MVIMMCTSISFSKGVVEHLEQACSQEVSVSKCSTGLCFTTLCYTHSNNDH